ncbi:Heterogeneous nuclear ribonucleoprotein A2 [Fasciolopsis buskii]|uniref:Heterogeneous nuclear ribonucleoprotein A2 n=1 Tax=Fasciolopsis buskii TaxID=27845 RepID=A0A8E0S1C7_9TREM|nr:Heterogeneous nuclear ribonucleoprotein A2 [Fasciolopsis buski]
MLKEGSSVDKAQADHPHKVDGKHADSKRAMPREESSPKVLAALKKTLVGGLKKDVTNEDFAEYFGKYGNVTDTNIAVAKDTNTSRSFAFMMLDDTDSVNKVILARPHMIGGHKADICKALTREELRKFQKMPPPARMEYNSSWNEGPNMGYQQPPWDQGYDQTYGGGGGSARQHQQYFNNSGYGYGVCDHSSGWPPVADGLGNYQQQQTYGGGLMRATPASTAQHTRSAPYTGSGWQQRQYTK